jgi:hypothetical protein
MDWNTKAELHRLELTQSEPEPRLSPKYLQGRDASFASLIETVMTMPRATQQEYSIMIGERIYLYSEIEALYNRPDFPKSHQHRECA